MSRVDHVNEALLRPLGVMARRRREQLGESRRGLYRRLARRGEHLAVTTIGGVEDGRPARGQTYAILERVLHWDEGSIMRYLTGGQPPQPVDPVTSPYWITHLTAATPGWWGISDPAPGERAAAPHPIAVWAIIEIPADRPGGAKSQAIIGLTPGHAPGPAGAPLPELDTAATRCVYSPGGPPPRTLTPEQFAAALADRVRYVAPTPRVTVCQVDESAGGEDNGTDGEPTAGGDGGG